MRVLFSSTPAFGHLLPLLPLARAARDAGDDVAILTAEEMGAVVAPLPLLSAGPTFSAISEEYYRRAGPSPVRELDAEAFGEFFAAVRIDLGADEAVAAARSFGAELVVAEREDEVGPLVAATLGVPWARFLLGADLPPDVSGAIQDRGRQRSQARGVQPTDPVATVDPWPEALQPSGWRPGDRRVPVRPEAYSADGAPSGLLTPGPVGERPRILLTPGTIAEDPEAVEAMVRSLADVDADVVLTGFRGGPWPIETDPDRVMQVPFAPMADLLRGIDVVVMAGGSGTTAAALAHGLPLVMSPLVFDQVVNARLAAATGAAVVAGSPAEVGSAVTTVLGNPSYRERAQSVAREIARMDPPATAWRRVRERAHAEASASARRP